jgi:hypothetical protein
MNEVQGLLESKDTHRPEGGPMLLGLALLYCRPLRRGVSLISSNPCTLEQQPPERDPKGSMAFLQNKVQCPPMLGA